MDPAVTCGVRVLVSAQDSRPEFWTIRIDSLVKSPTIVIPAKAGIYKCLKLLAHSFGRGD